VKILPSRHSTTPGQFVRVCFNARMSETRNTPPLVRARLSRPLRVDAVTWNAVRIGEQWCKSWIRCQPEKSLCMEFGAP